MRRINSDAPLTSQQKYKRYYDKHKDEVLAKNAEYLKDNKEKVNRRVRNRRHGITQEQYDAKIQKQDNRCAVCHKEFEGTPHFDHSHACCPNLRSCDKCRRGLLCEDCNLGLGRFKDSIEVLNNAIQYLKEYQKCQ
jgi:Recombination endonuclease VII